VIWQRAEKTLSDSLHVADSIAIAANGTANAALPRSDSTHYMTPVAAYNLILALTGSYITSSALTPYRLKSDTLTYVVTPTQMYAWSKPAYDTLSGSNFVRSGALTTAQSNIQTVTNRIDNPDSVTINGVKNSSVYNSSSDTTRLARRIRSRLRDSQHWIVSQLGNA